MKVGDDVLKREKTSGLHFFIKNSNFMLIVSCIVASLYGCLLVYSSIIGEGGSIRSCLVQFICSALGILMALFISQIDYLELCRLWYVWAAFALLLVLLTFTPLGLNVSGTDDTAWLGFPINNPKITFQPSELLKIAFIISFSVHLDKVRENISKPLPLLSLCLHGGFAAGLIFLQGDDGTALVFLFIFATMMFVAGLNLWYFAAAFAAVGIAAPFVWAHLDTQKIDRIKALIFVDDYLQTEGWQQASGINAIGSGKLWGVGFLKGGGDGLFARSNDFIFSVAGEEFGYIGSILLIILLMAIVVSLIRTAKIANDFKGTMICTGFAALISAQSIINIGMVLRLLPVIGITLPFFSSGGSSVATLYLGVGLCLSVHYQSKTRSLNRGMFKK